MKEITALKNKYYYYLPFYLATVSLFRGHRGSFLGWLWLVIKPTIQIGIYGIIFPVISRFQQDDYIYFLISGMLPWTFISNSVIEGAGSLISRADTIKRCIISRTVFPLADVIKHFILMIIALMVMLLIYFTFFGKINYHLLLLPIAMLPMILFTVTSAIAMSFMTPYIRDLNDIVGIGFNIMFFFTPLIFPFDAMPDKVKFWLQFNPFYWLIKPIQEVMYYKSMLNLKTYVISLVIALVTSILAFLIYKKLRKNVIFYL